MSDIKPKPHLHLIYSSSSGLCSEADSNGGASVGGKNVWQQIELFASEEPDTVIYASPEKCRMTSLVALMRSAHIRQIFDVRDIPHLAFEGGTRARFFEALSGLHVKYYSSIALETNEMMLHGKGVIDVLTKHIDDGPTMVFSDLEPEHDPDIQKINSFLSNSGINFKPVYVSLKEIN